MPTRYLFSIMAAAALLSVGGGATAQSVCAADDTACRLDRIEARLAEIERRLGGSPPPSPAAAVTVAADDLCGRRASDCQAVATRVCQAAGFSRGVTAQHHVRYDMYYVTRATCLD